MVQTGLQSLAAGVPILSTVRLHDVNNLRACDDPGCKSVRHGKPGHMAAAPNWIPWYSWADYLDFEVGEVWADEITGVASANDYTSLPSLVADKLNQMRRAEVRFYWTSPDFSNGVKKLRSVTQAVTVCRGMSSWQSADHVWSMNRAFMWKTYDARLMNDFQNQAARLQAYIRELAWKPEAFNAYDTFEPVLQLADPVWGGTCLRCGGKVSQPRCSCGADAQVRSVRPGAGHDHSGDTRVLELVDAGAGPRRAVE